MPILRLIWLYKVDQNKHSNLGYILRGELNCGLMKCLIVSINWSVSYVVILIDNYENQETVELFTLVYE